MVLVWAYLMIFIAYYKTTCLLWLLVHVQAGRPWIDVGETENSSAAILSCTPVQLHVASIPNSSIPIERIRVVLLAKRLFQIRTEICPIVHCLINESKFLPMHDRSSY